MSAPVTRIFLTKIPATEGQETTKVLWDTFVDAVAKSTKPYIISCHYGPVLSPDQRAQGFTFAAVIKIRSIEDVQHYDTACGSHQALKQGFGDAKLRLDGMPLSVTIAGV